MYLLMQQNVGILAFFFANNPFSASKIANKDQGNIGKQVLFFQMEFSNLVHCAYCYKTYVSTLYNQKLVVFPSSLCGVMVSMHDW